MSRRKAFETSLTSNPGPQANSHSNGNGGNKGKGKVNGNSDQKAGGGSGAGVNAKAARAPPAINPPDPSVGSATVPTETSAEKGKALAKAPSPLPLDDGGEENELCFICAEPVTFYSVGICGHRTCHVCAVRLRTFYKKSECTFCKTSTPSLLFSRSPDVPFPEDHHVTPSPANVIAAAQDNADKLPKGERWDRGLTLPGTLEMGSFPFTDDKLSVVFEDEAMMEETLLLLRFNCPYEGCAHMGHDWPSLEQHTLKVHGLVLCSLCRRQLSRFAHEQVLYPPHLLALHDPSRVLRGQRPPRPRGDEVELVKSWEAPHPMCEFCHQAFFGPDELFKHMREKHEECFVCRQLGEKDVYFQNYSKLEQHFGAEHYPCHQPICLEKKFVVFSSEHSEAMSARDRANMRHLPVEFQEARRRGDRGGDRSSAQSGSGRNGQDTSSGSGPSTMRRDASGMPSHQQIGLPPPMAPAQAAQARRAAQVDRQEESRRRRAFDTGLTGGLAANQGDAGSNNRIGAGGGAARSGFATPREDVDDATAGRHAALLSRIALLVQGNDNKLSSFRSAVRQFKNNESSAKDMIDTIFNVLDRDVESTVGVLREVAGLFDDDEKSRAVLEAVNGFRIEQREQFPALATPTGLGSNYAGITSGAILNAKRSTQSHRRGSTSQNVWDRVEAAAANQPVNRPKATVGANGRVVPGAGGSAFGFASGSRSGLNASAFPSLGAGAGAGSSKSTGVSGHSTPWAGGGAGGSSKTPSALTGVVRSGTSSSAFPSIGGGAQTPTSTSTSSGSGRTAKPPSSSAFPALPAMTAAQQAREERRALFSKPTPSQESVRRITGQAAAAAPPSGSGWGAKSPTGVGSMSDEMMAMQMAEEDERAAQLAHAEKSKKKGKGKQLLFQVSARPT